MQRFMGADLARKRAGKKTITGMSEKQLKDFATKPKVGYSDGGEVKDADDLKIKVKPKSYADNFRYDRVRG